MNRREEQQADDQQPARSRRCAGQVMGEFDKSVTHGSGIIAPLRTERRAHPLVYTRVHLSAIHE
jgi:hypothetical protein